MRVGSFRSVGVAAVLSVVLVLTVVTPVAAEDLPTNPTDVPPLVSSAPEIPVSTTPEGDFTDISAVASAVTSRNVGGFRPAPVPNEVLPAESAFDPDTSDLTSRTEFTNVYDNVDGSHTTEVGQVPLNAVNDEGD